MVCREFRLNVEKAINESKLPIDAVYYVLKDVMNEVTELYARELKKEEFKKKTEEKENEQN